MLIGGLRLFVRHHSHLCSRWWAFFVELNFTRSIFSRVNCVQCSICMNKTMRVYRINEKRMFIATLHYSIDNTSNWKPKQTGLCIFKWHKQFELRVNKQQNVQMSNTIPMSMRVCTHEHTIYYLQWQQTIASIMIKRNNFPICRNGIMDEANLNAWINYETRLWESLRRFNSFCLRASTHRGTRTNRCSA